MKALRVYNVFCLYPEGINNIDEFISFLNKNSNKFIHLKQLTTENCVVPYFIEEDFVECAVNTSSVQIFQEIEITLLSRQEYDRRLREIVPIVCKDCINFDDDGKLDGHRETLSLDGYCTDKQVRYKNEIN